MSATFNTQSPQYLSLPDKVDWLINQFFILNGRFGFIQQSITNGGGTAPVLKTTGYTGQFSIGRVQLNAGTVTITDASVTNDSVIVCTVETSSGSLRTTRSPGVSFTIISSPSLSVFVDYIIFY